MSIDARFHAEAMARRIAAADEAERKARYETILRRIRAESGKSSRTIEIDFVIGNEPGEINAKWFRSQLPADGSPITVKIHSEGGSVFEAFAIYDAIAAYPGRKTAVVESMAFSAASLLLCAFDEVVATPNAYCMLHAPRMESDDDLGESQQRLLAQLRERMIDIYAAKTGKPRHFIARQLDLEVFFDSSAAVDLGLVDRIASLPATVTARIPARVVAKINASKPTATAQWRAAVDAAAKTMPRSRAILSVEKSHPGLRQRMLDEVNKR